MNHPLLSAENLSIGYKHEVIAANINVTLPAGVVTAMIGRNGTGKSTLIKTLTGTLKPLTGKVKVGEKDISQLSRQKLAKLMAVVTTDPEMAGGLRVNELVALGRSPYSGILGRLSREDLRIVEKSLSKVGILHKANNFVGELSDGERQKAMIARGLAQSTPILIMDEPFNFLDVASRLEILELLINIAADEEKAILFSTHEVTQALRMVENIWMFVSEDNHRYLVEGHPEELILKGLVDRLFENSAVKYDRNIKDFIIETKHSPL